MKHRILTPALALILAASGPRAALPPAAGQAPKPAAAPTPPAKGPIPLVEARRGFQTRLIAKRPAAVPLPEPPGRVFRLVRYAAPAGKLAAYLSPDPRNGKKNPAILWITGGDCNSIDELWKDRPRANDQSAAAYRKAGVVMMFPSLRGGNDNPGRRESYLGEVDDVLAAADYLAKQDYVDPARIYLGGHSTGGTMAMLVAESSARFRGVFAFGPAEDVRGYDPADLYFDPDDPKEAALRSPGRWLDSVRSPLFVFEGTGSPGNIASLRSMAQASKNPLAHFFPVEGANHFNILAPINELIASKILRDRGPETNITFREAELTSPRR